MSIRLGDLIMPLVLSGGDDLDPMVRHVANLIAGLKCSECPYIGQQIIWPTADAFYNLYTPVKITRYYTQPHQSMTYPLQCHEDSVLKFPYIHTYTLIYSYIHSHTLILVCLSVLI